MKGYIYLGSVGIDDTRVLLACGGRIRRLLDLPVRFFQIPGVKSREEILVRLKGIYLPEALRLVVVLGGTSEETEMHDTIVLVSAGESKTPDLISTRVVRAVLSSFGIDACDDENCIVGSEDSHDLCAKCRTQLEALIS